MIYVAIVAMIVIGVGALVYCCVANKDDLYP